MTRRLNKDSMTGMQGRKKTEKTKTKNTETISRRIKRVSWRIKRKEKRDLTKAGTNIMKGKSLTYLLKHNSNWLNVRYVSVKFYVASVF